MHLQARIASDMHHEPFNHGVLSSAAHSAGQRETRCSNAARSTWTLLQRASRLASIAKRRSQLLTDALALYDVSDTPPRLFILIAYCPDCQHSISPTESADNGELTTESKANESLLRSSDPLTSLGSSPRLKNRRRDAPGSRKSLPYSSSSPRCW